MKEDDNKQLDPLKIRFFPWPSKAVFIKYIDLSDRYKSLSHFWKFNAIAVVIFYFAMFIAITFFSSDSRFGSIRTNMAINFTWIAPILYYFLTIREIKITIINFISKAD